MFSLCRLCAKCMGSTEKTTELSELEPKLSVCCGWRQSENDVQLPHKACSACVDQLQKSWSFAESVWAAENQLNKLIRESNVVECLPEKTEIKVEENDSEESDAMIDCDVFIEPIDYSDDADSHSEDQIPAKTAKIKTVQKTSSKDQFLSVLTDEERLESGLISASGISKLEKLYPDMKSVSWNDLQYQCKNCDRHFTGARIFCAHIRSMHIEEVMSIVVPCSYCNSNHRREYQLNRHIVAEHFPHLKYRCAHCTDYYWNTRELRRHQKLHRDVEYKCEVCSQGFFAKEVLYGHVTLTHLKRRKQVEATNEKFICDICSKVFASKSAIRSHLLLHTDKYDYICDQCGWKFQSKGNLKGHLASTHSKERPFQCEQCDKKFKTKYQLRNHMRHHDDIRPFECTECGKKFRRPYTLNVHMRSHTKICPYTCRFCGKQFRHNVTLHTHERAHTSDKPYACTNCEYRSTSKGNLNKHMMRVHSIDFRNQGCRYGN